jgi:hypothetical protein
MDVVPSTRKKRFTEETESGDIIIERKKKREDVEIPVLEELDLLPFDYEFIKKAKVIGIGAFGKVLKVSVNGM